MPKKPTKQQRAAIETGGSLLVTAAAGSGKTMVLVERVIRMLKQGKASIDRLLIVTFTNAAAAEMRQRIEQRLYEEAALDSDNKVLREQLLLLPSAQICTIDTFCIKLVRENFEYFSVLPDFKIITGNEVDAVYEIAINEIFEEFHAEQGSRMRALLDAMSCGGSDYILIDAVKKIFNFATTMPFPEHWLEGCKKLYADPTFTADTFWRKKLVELGETEELFTSAEAGEELIALAPHVITLIELTERFYGRVLKLMNEKNVLTFYNTEQMALSLLQSPEGKNTERAVSLSSQFDEILVDEYQDVNDLQDTLFYVLSSCGKKLFAVGDVKQSIYGFRGANHENFMRKNDSYLPLESKEEGGKRIALSENFRSRKGVCDYINFFFSLMMNRSFGGVDYEGDERLLSHDDFPQTEAPKAELHFISNDDSSDEKAVAEAKHIAAYIKKTILEQPFLKASDKKLKKYPFLDKTDDGLVAATYSDFAILMRTPGNGHADIYIRELKKAGIPVRFQSESFLSSREVMVVLSLLRVLSNPTHDVPLLALMLSPIFGFTHEDVAELKVGKKDISLYSALVLAEQDGNSRVGEMLNRIRLWRRMAVTIPVDRLLSRLYDETGLLDIVLSMPEGDDRHANLLLLQKTACEYTQNGGTLSGFAGYIEKSGENLKTPAPSAQNAVRLMSFHTSKGLQFPICIIAGNFYEFNKTDSTSSLVMDRHLGIAFKRLDVEKNTKTNTIARSCISRAVNEQGMSEQLRLLYVALTRAEERLVIMLTAKDHAKKAKDMLKKISENEDVLTRATSAYSWFLYSVLRGAEYENLRKAMGAEVPQELIVEGAKAKMYYGVPDEPFSESKTVSRAENAELLADILSRINSRYLYEECAEAPSKISVSEIVAGGQESDFSFKTRPAFMSGKGLTPAQRGTATHKFMQFCNFSAAAEDLYAEIERLKNMRFISPAEADAVNSKELQKFFSGELFSRMQSAELHREMRFISEIPVGKSEHDATVLQGVIDCVIDEGDFLSVLDFKTDRVKDEQELIDRYKKQLDIYASACEKLFGRSVKEKLIYSFALGKTVKVI